MSTLQFGLNSAIPAGTQTAWGARLIVSQDGYVDFVPDRQDSFGPDPQVVFNLLIAHYPFKQMCDDIRAMLEDGRMHTRVAQDFTLFANDEIEVHANTNASAGYCYVAAFRKETP